MGISDGDGARSPPRSPRESDSHRKGVTLRFPIQTSDRTLQTRTGGESYANIGMAVIAVVSETDRLNPLN